MPEPKVFNAATGQLVHAAAIADAAGGVTVDAQARAAINAILAVLRQSGVIAGATGLPMGHTFNGPTAQIVLSGAIADAAGGATIDAESRVAVNALLAVLRKAGVIAGSTSDPSILAMVFDEDTGAMVPGAAIINVAGGATIDAECRVAVNAALVACRSRNLIAQD